MILRITLDREITMDEIQSCTKITAPVDGKADYKYSTPGEIDPKYAYFQIQINGKEKILAVAGKVELYNVPVTETLTDTWDKETKGQEKKNE